MTKVRIKKRAVVGGRVWQGSQFYVVDDATLDRLVAAGAVEIVDGKKPAPGNKAHSAAPENKTRKRGRPRKVRE